MNLVSNLNFLGTMSIFASATFAVSGIGVKLGKFSSRPHLLGFKYISSSPYKKALYEATVELNKDSVSAYPFLTSADKLEDWCRSYETSTKKIKASSRFCQIRNNVWHKLIVNDIKVKKPPSNGCKLELLRDYADGKDSSSYLRGKRHCEDTSPKSPAK